METVEIDGEHLTLPDVESVARGKKSVRLSTKAVDRILLSQQCVENFAASEQAVYGVTTGFGALYHVPIRREDRAALQRNLIRSHSCALGDPLPPEDVRAVMLLRANALAKGFSGIRLGTLETLVAFLNLGICPMVPQQGSVGASGDLAPLAHVALNLMGEGKVLYQDQVMESGEALRRAALSPIEFQPKEGLALINGTQVMTGIGVLTLLRAERLAKLADAAGAITFAALKGNQAAYDRRIQELRPYAGQRESARNLLFLVGPEKHSFQNQPGQVRLQDPYSLRCIPQVHGAVRDVLKFIRSVLEIEINSATDNPLVFASENEILSGGNFHGEPVAFAMDFLGICISELANISERRIARLVDPHLSGLPARLAEDPGLNCGLGMLQLVAASLVSESKVLCTPASVDSIPTAANQEDHVSMGTTAARKARVILRNAEKVIAMEFICAAQGIDLGEGRKMEGRFLKIHEILRRIVPPIPMDRALQKDVQTLEQMIAEGEFLHQVEEAVGKLC